jgi:hypothetical protein
LSSTTQSWPEIAGLSNDAAHAYLEHYERMAEAVPFAIKVSVADSEQMRSLRPLFLLAIVMTGSSSAPKFEEQADDLFRRVLADRVIVQGHKSLELLQSLLSYLTWYHHRFELESQQFYQLLQLANGMVADLGLPNKYRRRDGFPNAQIDLNEARAFLLCYYLNVGGAVLGFNRAENMDCIESLRMAAELLDTNSPSKHKQSSRALLDLLEVVASRVGVPDGGLERELIHRWAEDFLHAGSPTHLVSSRHFIEAYNVLRRSGSQLMADNLDICVRHFRLMLENVFQHGLVYLLRLGIVEWCHLITALFLLAKITASTSSEQTQTTGVRSLLMQSINTLRSNVEQASAAHNQFETSAPHFMGWVDRILTALIQQVSRSEVVQDGTEKSAFELVNSFFTRKERPADDFWSDFMSEWLQW